MRHYIHHVPGRLRVRSAALRCRSLLDGEAQRQLLALEGVREVRFNPRASSLTLLYDPERIGRAQLLAALEQHGCVEVGPGTGTLTNTAGHLFGKALVGAFVNKAVERSAYKLVSVFI
ncbi:HMA2 domain-containing protein [Marichromatium bheemlicum]|uniref:Cation transporter n=1 Tax=Marichromatium bheemlicum TaxID=365339 RepID=A0ABX1I4D5_9GAMM|nr:heavy-metal-associated domain-containing protein [Marichromatium bheemlicum]NKN31951.1 cation transporter [Marichromatium bheemlicum]